MARQRRPGRGRRGANPGGPGGGAWRGDLVPPGFRGLGVMRPPRLRCTAERGDAAELRRGPRCSRAGELGRGRGGGPRQVGLRPGAIRRLGVVPGISGRAPLRARWPKGLGCGRLQVLAKPGVEGRAARSSVAQRFPTPRRRRTRASGAASGWARRGSRPGFAAFGMGFGRAFESCPIRQSYRTSPPHDKRGGFRATQRDKPPRKTHHAAVIRADLDLLADPPRDIQERRFRAASAGARAQGAPQRKPRRRQAFPPPAPIPAWARASGRAGEGEPLFAAGAGLALLDAFCAPIRPPPGRCAPAWRCRAPRPAPKSCASTPTQPRCATSASPSATRSGPRRTSCRCGATGAEPAAQPRPQPDCRRSGAARPGRGPERPRSEPEGLRRGGRSGFGGRKGRRPGVLRPPGRPSGPSRNFGALGVRHASSPSGCAGRGPCR